MNNYHSSNDAHAIADKIKELRDQIVSFPKATKDTKEYYSQIMLEVMAGMFLMLFEAKSGIENIENMKPEKINAYFKEYGNKLENEENESDSNKEWMDKECYKWWRAQLDTLWEIYRLATGLPDGAANNSPATVRQQKKGTSHQHLLNHLVGKLNAPKWKFWVSTKVKIDSARALVEIGQEAHSHIIDSLSGPCAAYVSIALKEIGTDAIPVCICALNTPGAPYATLVFKELGESGVDELIKQFSEEGSAFACLALKDIGRPALQKLIGALRNGDENIRMWSALTLGEMGTVASAALPALRNAQHDHSADVCQAATESIEKIVG